MSDRCHGGECDGAPDGSGPCRRHGEVQERFRRLRQRAFERVLNLCRRRLHAPAWSATELELEAELKKYRPDFVSVAYDRAMTLDYPGVPWFGRQA